MTVASAVAAFTGPATTLMVLPLVLAEAGAEMYGVWIVLSTVVTIGGLADLGMRTEVIRRTAAALGRGAREDIGRTVAEAVTVTLVVGGSVTTLLVAASPILLETILPRATGGSDVELLLILWSVLVLLLLSLAASVRFSVLRGVQRGDIEEYLRAGSGAIGSVVTLAGLLAGAELWSFVLGQAATFVLLTAGLWAGERCIFGRLYVRLPRPSSALARRWVTLSGLALVSQISDIVDNQWDKIVLARIVDLSSVTAYHIGTTVANQGRALAIVTLAALLPAIAELSVSDGDRSERLYRKAVIACQVVGLPVLATLALFGRAIIDAWIPSQVVAGQVLELYSVVAAVNLLSAPLTFKAFARGLHGVVAASALVNIITNLVASLALAIKVGQLGVVYGSMLGNTCGVVVMILGYRSRSGETASVPPLLPFVAVSSMVALGRWLDWGETQGIFELIARAVPFGAATLGVSGLMLQRYRRLPQ